ncbi:5'/3'-nucleotidase SurE [Oscillatoria sp. CS-180]|uniref:5'/3'-nucleotidase SurE n=1 Tax=Oscillatoria sp. CS-180 TaxID=3021720 RepID=UPI00232A90C6|nr:5'/3'-nucleotidase SurE [Oscillatoria sp. CS-180]MDB9527544.1 5'/3'-nucleotidase SurE [Oscillatoria sp. CS-180]
MILVLTNDDGIDAPGIRALEAALPHQQTVMVAPDQPLSGCSHQLNRGGPIAIQQRGEDEYAIAGTPADCTRVAMSYLCPQAQWVLSGINAGGNMGSDIYVSGTVAAVREATLLRVPGIAISQYIKDRRPIDWEISTRLATKVLHQLMQRTQTAGRFWNVNLPCLTPNDPDPQMIDCPLCTQPLPTEHKVDGNLFYYVGKYSDRRRDAGADVDICLSGNISICEIRLW